LGKVIIWAKELAKRAVESIASCVEIKILKGDLKMLFVQQMDALNLVGKNNLQEGNTSSTTSKVHDEVKEDKVVAAQRYENDREGNGVAAKTFENDREDNVVRAKTLENDREDNVAPMAFPYKREFSNRE